MVRRALVHRGDGSFDLVEQAAPNEKYLRETMRNHALLIPMESWDSWAHYS